MLNMLGYASCTMFAVAHFYECDVDKKKSTMLMNFALIKRVVD